MCSCLNNQAQDFYLAYVDRHASGQRLRSNGVNEHTRKKIRRWQPLHQDWVKQCTYNCGLHALPVLRLLEGGGPGRSDEALPEIDLFSHHVALALQVQVHEPLAGIILVARLCATLWRKV